MPITNGCGHIILLQYSCVTLKGTSQNSQKIFLVYLRGSGQASELRYIIHIIRLSPISFPVIMSTSKGQFSFFNLETHLEKIYQINNFLLKLNVLINWEIFRETLNIVREKERKSNYCAGGTVAGRPPFDVMLMFKVLVLECIKSWFGVIKATNQRPTEREQLCCDP